MKCKLCNQHLVIIDIDGTKACINPKCKVYAGKDLNNPNATTKTQEV